MVVHSRYIHPLSMVILVYVGSLNDHSFNNMSVMCAANYNTHVRGFTFSQNAMSALRHTSAHRIFKTQIQIKMECLRTMVKAAAIAAFLIFPELNTIFFAELCILDVTSSAKIAAA